MAATMAPFQVGVQKMLPYPSIASNVVHFTYNNPNVIYNNPEFTYQYTTYRGNATVRVRRGVVMEGK